MSEQQPGLAQSTLVAPTETDSVLEPDAATAAGCSCMATSWEICKLGEPGPREA